MKYTYETLPQHIRDEMFKRHQHADMLHPHEICYRESDVIEIINLILDSDVAKPAPHKN